MKNKIINIIQIFLSVIICLFLVFLSVITPFYYSVTAFTKPETIVKIVQDIDYKKLAKESKAIKNVFKEAGLTAAKADKLIKSDDAGRLIEVYADEAVELIMDIPVDKKWNVGLLREVVNDNIERITEIAEETTGKSVSQNLLHAKIDSTLSGSEAFIKEAEPIINRVKVVVETVEKSQLIKRSMTPAFAVALGIVFLLCIASVIFLRRKNFMGLFWLVITMIVSVMLLLVIIIYSSGGFINELARSMSDFGVEIISSAVSICVDNLVAALIFCSAAAVIFSSVFVILYCKKPHLSIKNQSN